MIMVNLPFPPLPIRGLNCENEDRMLSGHDLLSRAIACTMLGPQTSAAEVSLQVGERKQSLLKNMHEMIAKIWGDDSVCEDERLQQCYVQFCSVFRAYMRLYPGPDDLRIMPMENVDPKSVLCTQAVRHLQARLLLCESLPDEERSSEYVQPGRCAHVCTGMRYRDLIRAYAIDLYESSKHA